MFRKHYIYGYGGKSISIFVTPSDIAVRRLTWGQLLLGRSSQQVKGKVYLVGAGRCDPDLLTVKAVRTLGVADVVLQDALVSSEVLALVSPRARIINVGKRSLTDRRTADQLLVISAHRGHGQGNSDWHSLVTSRSTVVVYMPGAYAGVAEDLLRAGLSSCTPCAVISQVSSAEEQRTRPLSGSLIAHQSCLFLAF